MIIYCNFIEDFFTDFFSHALELKQMKMNKCAKIFQKQTDCIDLFKLIGSIMIFSMHAKAFGDNKYLLFAFELCARWAVPFFFIVSSFFLANKTNSNRNNKETVKKYCHRIFLLYLLWMLINLPSIIYSRLYFQDLNQLFTWLVFIKNSLLSSTFKGSWYLMSSMFSAWLIFDKFGNMSTKKAAIISFPMELLCVITSIYAGLLSSSVSSFFIILLCFPLNLFGGVFYFAIGKYIYENRNKLISYSYMKLLIIGIIGYFLFIFEIIFAQTKHYLGMTDCSLFLIPVAISITGIAFKLNWSIKKHLLLRKLSTIIYCCQGNVLLFSSYLESRLNISSCFLVFIIAILLCIFICIGVLFLQRHSKIKILKYLT